MTIMSTKIGAGQVAWLALTAALVSCREPTVVETTATVVRTSNEACAAADGMAAHMDKYILEMYEVLPAFGRPANPTAADCRNCIANPDFCRQEPPTCVCGGEFAATPDNLKVQVKGMRIRGLDSTDLYC